MTTKKQTFVLVLVIVLVGCTTNQILNDLQDIVALAEIALPIVESTVGLPPAVVSAANVYLNSVSTGLDQTTALIPADGVITLAIATQIAGVWAGVVALDLPAGTPQEIVTALSKIAPAILTFLQSIGVTTTSATKATVSSLKSNITLSAAQLTQLRQLQQRAKVIELATKK